MSMITPITRYGHMATSKRKTGKQFLDFIERIDQQKYDSSVKRIYLILDNISIHKSNKVRQTISKSSKDSFCISSTNPNTGIKPD